MTKKTKKLQLDGTTSIALMRIVATTDTSDGKERIVKANGRYFKIKEL